MAAPRMENQVAQRQSGTGGFGVGTVSSIPCRERETHADRGSPGSVPTRGRRRIAGQPHACVLSVPGPGPRLRPERLGHAHLGTGREPDALRQLLRRRDRDRRQDEAARAGSRGRDPREGPELPRTRRVQHGRVGEGEAGELVGEGPPLPSAHGGGRLRAWARLVGDQRALERGSHEARLAGESPRCDAGPLHRTTRSAAAAGRRLRRRSRAAARQLRAVQGSARGLARQLGLVDGRVAVRGLVGAGGLPELLAHLRRRLEGRGSLDAAQRVHGAPRPARVRGTAPGRARTRPLRPHIRPADDGLLARCEGLRQQPHLAGPDGDAREPRGLCGARLGDPEPVPGRAYRLSRGTSIRRVRRLLRCRLWRLASRSRSRPPTATAAPRRGRAARPARTRGARPSSAAPGSTRAGRRSRAGERAP